jgi:hypothetical protein
MRPRVWQGFELADWGGPKPTWRPVGPLLRRGAPSTVRTTIRPLNRRHSKRALNWSRQP